MPAFPAVYGGAIQMFGRAYGGGPTKDLALRMKAGQQLVFGEQIGWIGPGMVLEKENGAFFRDVVLLRRKLRRYFYAGEMARPPRLVGHRSRPSAPTGSGAASTGSPPTPCSPAPGISRPARRLVLVFVNVSDQPVTAQVDFDPRPYGFAGSTVSMTRITPAGKDESVSEGLQALREATFPPRSAWAWEMTEP